MTPSDQPFALPDGVPAAPSAPDVRRRRQAAGLNAVTAVLLAGALAVLVNLLGSSLYLRGSVSAHLYGELTERTRHVLSQTEGDLQLIAFFEKGHALAAPVRALLQEFAEASRTLPNLRIRTRIVDPNRDVAVAADLARRYSAEPNSLIILTSTHHRILTPEELVVTQAPGSEELGLADFAGESAVASAIWNATRAGHPVVCFLTGDGEHDPFDYDRLNGYSSIGRLLRRDRYEVRSIPLEQGTSVPEDCSLLVIAGPRTNLGGHVVEQVNTYLSTGGRVLLLLDNVADPALQGLLKEWGIQAFQADNGPGLGGSNIKAGQLHGTHPITRMLGRLEVTFEAPCRLEVLPDAARPGHADKPHATVLLSAVSRVPGTDPVGGPLPGMAMAVASERGLRGEDEHSYLARIVVVGDAQFGSNAMVDGGLDGNRDFFLSTVHWLTEQEVLIGRMPVTFRILRAGISPGAWPRTILLVVVLWPASFWTIGLVLTHRRRRCGWL